MTKVRGLDNFLTGKPSNLAGLYDRIDFREVDLRDAAAVRSACEGIDYILHLGALPSGSSFRKGSGSQPSL